MEWFRLYNEFRADPKLLKFTKSERYDLVCLLCMASESTERGAVFLDSEDLAASFGITEPEYIEFEARLVKKGIVYRREDGALVFLHWPTRQPDHDDAAERMRKLREKKRSEQVEHAFGTVPNGVRNCSVLGDRTEQNRTDKNRTENTTSSPALSRSDVVMVNFVAQFWDYWPKKTAKQEAFKAWRKLNPDAATISAIQAGITRLSGSPQWQKDEGQYIPNAAKFLNTRRWEDEIGGEITIPVVRKSPEEAKAEEQRSQAEARERSARMLAQMPEGDIARRRREARENAKRLGIEYIPPC